MSTCRFCLALIVLITACGQGPPVEGRQVRVTASDIAGCYALNWPGAGTLTHSRHLLLDSVVFERISLNHDPLLPPRYRARPLSVPEEYDWKFFHCYMTWTVTTLDSVYVDLSFPPDLTVRLHLYVLGDSLGGVADICRPLQWETTEVSAVRIDCEGYPVRPLRRHRELR